MIWKDLPSEETPISSSNLNKISDAIQYEEPTNGQELWLKKSKNLSPKEKTTTTNEKLGCHLKSGVTYSMSFDWSGSGMNIKENDNSGTTLRTIYGGTHITTTITPTQDCDVFINSWGVTEYPHNIMINEGSTALPYEPYDNSEILTKQDNSYNKFTDTVNVGVDSNSAGLWVEASKNMFDKYSMIYSDRAFLQFDTSSTKISDYGGTGTYILVIKLSEGKTYTISKRAGGRFRAGFTTTSTPRIDVNGVITSRLSNNDTGTSITFTVPTGSPYFVCNFYSSDQTLDVNVGYENILNSIQIEEGPTATQYEPYVVPNIKVFNNGQYETIVRKNVYSTEETIVGEFMGKTLYRKVISFGALPNNSGKSVAHGITNIDRVVDLKFIAQRGNDQSAGNFEALNISNSGNASSLGFNCYFNATNINIATNSDRSAYIGFLTVEYTKTTGGATLMSMLPPSNNEEE